MAVPATLTRDTCPHDGTAAHRLDLPKSTDFHDLIDARAVSTCCGAMASFSDQGELYCKCCFEVLPCWPNADR